MVSRKGYLSVRVDDDLETWVTDKANKEHISKSEVVRCVLKSYVNGSNRITIINKKTINYETNLERRFNMSAIIKKYSNYAMNIIVRKEEYSFNSEIIDEDIKIMINAIDNKMENIKEIDNDYKYILKLKELFVKREFDIIKKVIDYKQRRWKWILDGKIMANKLETTILENRLQEVKSRERVANDRKN